jgi:HSP20 family protein
MQQYVKEAKFYFSRQSAGEPLLDAYETDDRLVFEIDLPGINPEDIDIRVFEDFLVIEGARYDADQDLKGCRYICMERCMESFKRIVKIPAAINPQGGKASYRNGVVKIIFPKVEEEVIRIEIERQEGE